MQAETLFRGVRLRGGQRGQQLAEARRDHLDAGRPRRGLIANCEHRLPAQRRAEHILPPGAEGGVRGVGAEEQGDAALGDQQPFVQAPRCAWRRPGVSLGRLERVSASQLRVVNSPARVYSPCSPSRTISCGPLTTEIRVSRSLKRDSTRSLGSRLRMGQTGRRVRSTSMAGSEAAC